MRYERKYKIEDISPAVVRQTLRLHPASFRPLFPDRQVNNIYFDTPSLTAYNENVNGISERKKFRARWYGEDIHKIVQPKLEIKIKENQLGAKVIKPLDAFDLTNLDPLTEKVNQLTYQSNTSLRPVLLNAYRRSYYGTTDGHFRITIDYGVQYFSFLNAWAFTRFNLKDSGIIVELKYEEDQEENAQRIMQQLPFRQTKSSKYVNGLNMTLYKNMV